MAFLAMVLLGVLAAAVLGCGVVALLMVLDRSARARRIPTHPFVPRVADGQLCGYRLGEGHCGRGARHPIHSEHPLRREVHS